MQQFFFDIFLISRDVLPNHKLKLYNPFEFFSCCTNQEYWINFRKANKMGEILRSIYLSLLNNNLNVRRFLARRWPIKLYLTFLQFGQIWFLWSSHWGSFSPFSFLYVSLFFIRGEKIRLLYKFCVRETMLDLFGTIKL
jgi:hypothetical protein